QRLGIRLSQPLLRRLHQYAVAKGRKESAIIEELVADHLASGGGRHTESSPASSVDRLVAAINEDRAARAADLHELLRAVDLLSEAFGRFVGFWMATAPSGRQSRGPARRRGRRGLPRGAVGAQVRRRARGRR
ncbi:MAG TPA: hypothetical protein VEK07_15365, partial [Polyangiaceae bacterium]|nr:hypothetical protein [Polyangiaceae bacterium]